MGGMAGEADEALAVAQAIIRRNLRIPDPACGLDLERMGETPLLREVALLAEIDGGRGEPDGVRI
jgi:hypothetical protein